jgi:hypothetical protein
LSPVDTAIESRWLTRAGVGKPLLLLAIFCAFLMPLSNPVASSAISDASASIHFTNSAANGISAVFIQRQIVHIATHPKAGVPFLTAFLTEAERLCQPRARIPRDAFAERHVNPPLRRFVDRAAPCIRVLVERESIARRDGNGWPV